MQAWFFVTIDSLLLHLLHLVSLRIHTIVMMALVSLNRCLNLRIRPLLILLLLKIQRQRLHWILLLSLTQPILLSRITLLVSILFILENQIVLVDGSRQTHHGLDLLLLPRPSSDTLPLLLAEAALELCADKFAVRSEVPECALLVVLRALGGVHEVALPLDLLEFLDPLEQKLILAH